MPTLREPTFDSQGERIDNTWLIVRDPAAQAADVEDVTQDLVVPLSYWQGNTSTLLSHTGRIGVWLSPDDDPLELAPSIPQLALVAVYFPAFNDGRGLSSAVLVRTRLKFTGDLRAIGDVRQDQLSYMRRCGFSSFTPPADANIDEISKGLVVMSDYYQGSVTDPAPLFRRRARS